MKIFWVATVGVMIVLVVSSSLPRSVKVSDPLSEWSVAAQAAADASGMVPLRAPITFAILHLAMYDAVNAIAGDRQPYAVTSPVVRPASPRAAATEAGYRILLEEFPSQKQLLDPIHQKLLSSEPPSQETANGVKVGANVAAKFLAHRANDKRNLNTPYTPGSGPGAWLPTPPQSLSATTRFLAQITPFTMDTPAQFRPAGPPALSSKRWADDYNEVLKFGAKDNSARSREQTATGLFWEPLAGTVWPATIRRIAKEQGLDFPSSARFQAAAFAAFADGLIACWDAKFHFNFWRPVTAIRAGQSDGNELTAAVPDWQPLSVTPNFPEYPSGHACVTAAVAHTIEDFFTHPVPIPAKNVVSGEERIYKRAVDVVAEVVEARMLIGVHFRAADEDGAEIGRKIAQQAAKLFDSKRLGRVGSAR